MRLKTIATFLILATASTACLPLGVYGEARTLKEDQTEVSLAWNATKWTTPAVEEVTDAEGEVIQPAQDESEVWLPNLLPEVGFGIGITDDLTLGGRAALGSMYFELNGKYRFLDADAFQMAAGLQLGGRTFLGLQGANVTVPLWMSYDVSPKMTVTLSPYVQYSNISTVDSGSDDDLNSISGESLYAGGSVSILFKGRTLHFGPTFEYQHSVKTFVDGDSMDTPDFMMVGLILGFPMGEELESLDRIEDKLNSLK